MTATEVPMPEFVLRRLLDESYALNKRCAELIADPFGASWGPPWDESEDVGGYSRDEDPV
jgi:hypothetical protein